MGAEVYGRVVRCHFFKAIYEAAVALKKGGVLITAPLYIILYINDKPLLMSYLLKLNGSVVMISYLVHFSLTRCL